MGDNYRAWNINYKDFDKLKTESEKIRFLIKFAVLAPSTHNTQPWTFSVKKNSILVKQDNARALPKSDPLDRFLLFSLGCAVENIVTAAGHYGYSAEIRYRRYRRNNLIKIICLRKKPDRKKIYRGSLISQIPKRFTDRSIYEQKLPSKALLGKLKKLSLSQVLCSYVTDKSVTDKLIKLMSDAEYESTSKKYFREELSNYIKADKTESYIGMPGFVLGMPSILASLAPFILPRLNLAPVMVKKNLALLTTTPVFGIISTKFDKPSNWLAAGRSFERLWLHVTKYNLHIHPMASVASSSKYLKKVQRLLSLEYRPQMLFRIGYSRRKPLYSPRFLAEKVMQP